MRPSVNATSSATLPGPLSYNYPVIKLYSWNVNGIRAVVRKGALQEFMAKHKPDIVCLQETKAQKGQAEIDFPGYEEYWNSAHKPGYSGTAIFSKINPLKVVNGFPDNFAKKYKFVDHETRDSANEGRVIAAEFPEFWVVTVYTPNAKDDLSRIPLRHKHWDPAFLTYVKGLETGEIEPTVSDLSIPQGAGEQRTETYNASTSKEQSQPATQRGAKSAGGVSGFAGKQDSTLRKRGKPVVFCGDLNVAHTEDDLANPKPNRGKKGFTDEEREGFQNFIDAGFLDTFRLFHKGNGHYTWWTHWANARARNVGWRIDYWLASAKLKPKIKAAAIHADVMGSDHAPISLTLDL